MDPETYTKGRVVSSRNLKWRITAIIFTFSTKQTIFFHAKNSVLNLRTPTITTTTIIDANEIWLFLGVTDADHSYRSLNAMPSFGMTVNDSKHVNTSKL